LVLAGKSGPFVNHNHFAQFMNLSIGATLGLLFFHLGAIRPKPTGVVPVPSSPRWRRVAVLVGLALLQLLSVVLSLSRGGTLGAMAGLIIAFGVLATQQRKNVAFLLPILAGAALVAVFLFDANSVWGRFAAARSGSVDRLEMVRDALHLCRKFPVLGIGLGAHQAVFPSVDGLLSDTVATHLENEYVQMFEETGLVGSLIVLAFLVYLLVSFETLLRLRIWERTALAGGIAYGLSAGIIHSFSDFGQHRPAVGMLSAVFCGLIINLSQPLDRQEIPRVRKRWSTVAAQSAKMLPGVLTAVSLIGCTFAVRCAFAAAYSTDAENISASLEQHESADSSPYNSAIAKAKAAVDLSPDDAALRYRLCCDQWQADSRFEVAGDSFPIHALWVIDELKEARRQSPMSGEALSMQGQIEYFILHQAQGAVHIHEGYHLDHNDASTCFAEGRLQIFCGAPDLAVEPVRRAVELDPARSKAAVELFSQEANRPDLALEVANQSPMSLLDLADRFAGADKSSARHQAAIAARRRAVSELAEKSAAQTATAENLELLARLDEEDGKLAESAECFKRALSERYERTDWRLAFARVLLRLGRADEARRQAELCVQINPAFADASRFAQSIANPDRSKPSTAQ
jgi:tetratricopeptide (TPR) repeat protein